VCWSLELCIFETVTLQDGAYGDRCEGRECVRAERGRDLGRKERNKLLAIYYLQQQMYIYKYITNAATCFGASAPSSRSFYIAFAEVTKY
jgi:hypothetical protein